MTMAEPLDLLDAQIALMVDKMPKEDQEKLSKDLDIDVTDLCAYQQAKSLAVAKGTLTLENGVILYEWLGNSPTEFNAQPLSRKIITTRVIAALLEIS